MIKKLVLSSSDENGLIELDTIDQGIFKINEFCFDKDEYFTFVLKLWNKA